MSNNIFLTNNDFFLNQLWDFYKFTRCRKQPFYLSYALKFLVTPRNKDGWLSGLMNKYILSRLIGYTLDKNIVNSEMNNDRVKAANEKPVLFKDTE
ncbi:hypothetical protein S562_004201 [Salmonella enterica subsp. enterica]|nr:hypothetical protein [Salmonella enterica]EBZ5047745.1 hypothetical protein [Salmonella enterica subsp. enterica serovar Poona]ECX8329133.1 hypothetical protein [Salmonella enterica]EDV3470233.1 hypothetical protein [Salmonella enterica subsp. enterica serovar Poona]